MIELITFSGMTNVLGEDREVSFKDGQLAIEGLSLPEAQAVLAQVFESEEEATAVVVLPEPEPDPAPEVEKPKKRTRRTKAQIAAAEALAAGPKAEESSEPEPEQDEDTEEEESEPALWSAPYSSLSGMVKHLLVEEKITDHDVIFQRMDEVRTLDSRMANNKALQDPESFKTRVTRAIEKEAAAAG